MGTVKVVKRAGRTVHRIGGYGLRRIDGGLGDQAFLSGFQEEAMMFLHAKGSWIGYESLKLASGAA